MHVGVTIFLTDRTIDPVELAVAVEERGFHSLYVPEHTHIPTSRRTPPPTGEADLAEGYKRVLDPYIALAAMAATTSRILLGTGIALVAQHDPIVLAKQIATLDRLAGGRFVLGLGFGWNHEEMLDHGVDPKQRWEVAREHTLAMQALWADDVAEFHGSHVDLPPCWQWPKPLQRPGVRTLIGGGSGPKLFAAVVEYADGWMPIGGAGLAKDLPRLHQLLTDAGRDPAALHVVPFGTLPDAGKLARYRELGVTEVILRLPEAGRDEVLPVLDDFARYLEGRRDLDRQPEVRGARPRL